jgi:DNA-binding transcriptional ArsR family regulator
MDSNAFALIDHACTYEAACVDTSAPFFHSGTMDSVHAVRALSALAQISRLHVFRFLVERGPLGANPGEIAEQIGLAPNTLSFHLKELSHAGLVQADKMGRFLRYRADMGAMDAVVDYLTENCCAGNPALCTPAKKTVTKTAAKARVTQPASAKPRTPPLRRAVKR